MNIAQFWNKYCADIEKFIANTNIPDCSKCKYRRSGNHHKGYHCGHELYPGRDRPRHNLRGNKNARFIKKEANQHE